MSNLGDTNDRPNPPPSWNQQGGKDKRPGPSHHSWNSRGEEWGAEGGLHPGSLGGRDEGLWGVEPTNFNMNQEC